MIRPASAASATRPGQHQQHQRRPVFPLGRLKSHLPQRTEIWPRGFAQLQMGDSRKNPRILAHPPPPPPPPHPPLITPSSLCEVMNEAPSREAFVTIPAATMQRALKQDHGVGVKIHLAGALTGMAAASQLQPCLLVIGMTHKDFRSHPVASSSQGSCLHLRAKSYNSAPHCACCSGHLSPAGVGCLRLD